MRQAPTTPQGAAPTALLLLTNLQRVFTCTAPLPGALEPTAILVGGGKVLALLTDAEAAAALAALPQLISQLDATGLIAVPGFIDIHAHICGGGGEAGPSSRTPEARLSQLLLAGITCVVGVTGTDGVTRSQENLVAKARALTEDGISAFHWCGSYALPPVTATGSVERDLCLLTSCVGVGEVAVADHRGSAPSPRHLAQLGLEARRGGMLSGKAGLVHCHLGPGSARLQPLREAIACSSGDLPLTTFHPTHMARSPELVADAAGWLADGGTLDVTCDSPACRAALQRWRSGGVPLGGVTVSTDAWGSLPVFDEQGRLVAYDVADPGTMLQFVRSMHLEDGWPLEQVLPWVTSNPARILKLAGKGAIAAGHDADLLLLEPSTLALRYVVARGQVVKTPEWVRGGLFERGESGGCEIRPRTLPQAAA